MENLNGYKTVIFFGISLLIAVANLFGFGEFSLSGEQKDIIFVVVSALGLVLRYYSKGKIFEGVG